MISGNSSDGRPSAKWMQIEMTSQLLVYNIKNTREC
jgi:hypothetical protein